MDQRLIATMKDKPLYAHEITNWRIPRDLTCSGTGKERSTGLGKYYYLSTIPDVQLNEQTHLRINKRYPKLASPLSSLSFCP